VRPVPASVKRATAPGRLLTGTNQRDRQAPPARTVTGAVTPEFAPQRNSELSGSRGLRFDDPVRLEIREQRVRPSVREDTCLRACAAFADAPEWLPVSNSASR
jgi:hypothetical protein